MTYIFNTMRENHLIKAADTIALGMPIFTPYIEIPRLNDYQLNVVNIEADVEDRWQYSKKELDKLRDPKVKAFFLVNPSNPPSVKISDESLEYIADIVKERPDLILLTDDVYGTLPTTSCRCSRLHRRTRFSCTRTRSTSARRVAAWHDRDASRQRSGPVAVGMPKDVKKELHHRYESITTEPDKLKFIDRLVADSRTVALNHTAGLSTPQQYRWCCSRCSR